MWGLWAHFRAQGGGQKWPKLGLNSLQYEKMKKKNKFTYDNLYIVNCLGNTYT